MARQRGPLCRLCRREGIKLFLKGDRCYTPKCAVERKGHPPGQHGRERRKLSEYGVHLREKQKVRRFYGVLERQFRRYVARAMRTRGVTGTALLRLLERRLDNVVHRAGLAASRAEARQLVNHGHFQVNGRKVDVPSYLLRQGDVVEVREGSRSLPRFKELAEAAAARRLPDWLSADYEAMRVNVLRYPEREEIDLPVKEQLIVEHYAR